MGQSNQHAVNRKTRKKTRLDAIGIIKVVLIPLLILAIIISAVIYGYMRMQQENIISHVTIECGQQITKDRFFKNMLIFDDAAEFQVDLEQVDTNIPQDFMFNIVILNQVFPVRLTVADTAAPTCTVVPYHMYANEQIPDASELVTDVYDAQQPVSIEYMTEPDLTCTNTSIVYCKLEDLSGNINIVEVPFYITQDVTPPVIEGVHYIDQYAGDSIAYRDGITVTDDIDPAPTLEIDNSGVDMDHAGDYTVIYTATDAAGNSTTVEGHIHLVTKPATYVEDDVVMAAATNLLNSITNSNMTDMEKALKIFRWCRYNINYIQDDRIDITSWNRVAYDGLTLRHGTCYTFAITAKYLLDAAGIPNMIVNREPYRHKHFWNLIQIDGQWYHCDSTPRMNYNSFVFMYTDRELANFWVDNYNGYSFNHSKYPASATSSVQSRINYASGTVR